MKLTDKVKEIETVKHVTSKEIRDFFESLDYDKAVITTDRLRIKVKFNGNTIKLKDYPFPTDEESDKIFEIMGISDVITSYNRNGTEYFYLFEFTVDRNKMETVWYK
jgi:hypothetical protein